MKKIILPIIGVLALTAFFSIFIVKEVNQAIVLQFGDPKRILLKPGLNFKLPFIQNVVFLDKRILNLDAPPEEVIASDQKRLIVDAFARFQIVDPLKFYISVGNERVARSRLSTIINSRIRNVLGQQRLQTVVRSGINLPAAKYPMRDLDQPISAGFNVADILIGATSNALAEVTRIRNNEATIVKLYYKFNIDAGGNLSFKSAPNFEIPTDTDANNTYQVEVKALESGGFFSTQIIRYSVKIA